LAQPEVGAAFSAHRQGAYSCLVVDVHPGSGPGTVTTLRVQAVMPEQHADVITAPARFAQLDSVHITRTVS
jgi:hypothetical protein